ncbi:YhgE/Pip domain-containing protein [Lacticaseibacillus saniviri]
MFKHWFKHPIAYVAIAVSIICGIAFVGAGLPGFGNMPKGTESMKIVIVDEDQSTGSQAMTKGMQDNMPFKVTRSVDSISDAKKQLENREIALAVRIPKNFIADVRNQKTPKITYYQNDSNGMLQNSMSKNIATSMTQSIQTNLTSQKTIGMIASLIAPNVAKAAQAKAQQQAKNITNPQQAAAMKAQVQKQTQAQVQKQATAMVQKLSGGLKSSTVHLNKMHDNYQYQMAPMFLNLGTYLGIMTIILTMMFMSARFSMGKVKAYMAFQMTGLLAAVIQPFFTVGLLRALINFSGATFWTLVGSEMLFCIAVFEFCAMFTFLCASLPAMAVLLPLMAMQVVSGGGILPRVVLSDFYQWVSKVTPMYQGVTTSLNALFGGASSPYFQSMLWIAVVGLVVSSLIAWIGYRGKERKGFANVLQVGVID